MRPRTVAAIVVPLLVLAVAVPAAVVVAVTAFFATNAGQAAAQTCEALEGSVVTTGSGQARVPVAGKFIYNSKFGMRQHPVLGYARPHNGADFVTLPTGGQVVAAKAGQVARVVHGDPGAGNYVEIDHGGGMLTRYFHLASIAVEQGDRVAAGAPVGIEGTTGMSTGEHLHFEVHQGGTPIDPVAWLASQGVQMPPLKGTATAPPAGAASDGDDPAVEVLEAASPSESKTVAGPQVSGKALAGFNPQQVGVAAEIIRAAKTRGLDEWTSTVGVMTGIGESGLREIGFGDAAGPDSRGVFQQRDSWGPLEVRMDAYSSALLFFDALTKVKGYRQMSPTMAAHSTQRNAVANHYAKFWGQAVELTGAILDDPNLVASLGAGDGAAPGCAPQTVAVDLPGGPGECPATGDAVAEKGLQPTALHGMRCTKGAFEWITTIYGVGERVGPSDHGGGLAADFMIPDYSTSRGRERGWQVAHWVRENAAALKVKYVIFDQKIWNVERDGEGWRPYTRYSPGAGDTLLHKDHVHVSYLGA